MWQPLKRSASQSRGIDRRLDAPLVAMSDSLDTGSLNNS